LDQLAAIQADIQQSTKEMAVFHKQYVDDETLACDTRKKQMEAEER